MGHRRRTFTSHEADRIIALDGVPLAPFGRRAAAFIVDLGIVTAVFIAVSLVPALGQRELRSGDLIIQFSPFQGLWSLGLMVLYFGVLTYFGRGRTPGKRLVRIRVVSTSHQHLSLWHSIERALGYAASALEGGFGFVQYFIHPNCRTVHDRIAETIVVDDRTVAGTGSRAGVGPGT